MTSVWRLPPLDSLLALLLSTIALGAAVTALLTR